MRDYPTQNMQIGESPPPSLVRPYLSRLVGEVDRCDSHATRLENLLDRALGGRLTTGQKPPTAAEADTLPDLERRLDALADRLESIAQRADTIA